jgi:Ni/Co efflux regulator RcnB
LRRNVQASHRFHVGAYQAPAGYRARHWSHGQRLPGFLFARNYWLLNYEAYALFPPPPGLVWVRVGADALLIDQDTGEIIQVDYGVFY